MKKKVMIILLAMFAGMSMMAIEPTNVSVRAASDYEDDSYDDCDTCVKKFDFNISGIYFGWGGASINDQYSGMLGATQEVGILIAAGVEYNFGNKNRLTFGVGYQAKWYNLKSDYSFVGDDNGNLDIVDFPLEFKKTSSMLAVHTFQFPLLYSKGINKNFELWAGPIMNWNFYASYKRDYKVDKTHINESTNGIHQRKISFDVVAGMNFKAIGLYFRYSPQSVLKDGTGPKIDNRWSLGIIAGF
ncbi:MAG: hypothetical protein J6S96_04210 [Muribaculaceae bacterium]|nr:hypothetical protein [Muribaculaceae bacterium]